MRNPPVPRGTFGVRCHGNGGWLLLAWLAFGTVGGADCRYFAVSLHHDVERCALASFHHTVEHVGRIPGVEILKDVNPSLPGIGLRLLGSLFASNPSFAGFGVTAVRFGAVSSAH